MAETNDPLVEMLDIGVRHVRKILIEDRQRELMPFYHLVAGKPGEGDRIISSRWKNEVEKQLIVIEVKNQARQIDAVRALFVGEGWMLQLQGVDRSQLDKVLAYGPVREHPQRIEVVQLAAFDGERSKARLLRMVRDRPGGRIVALELDKETDHFEGRLIDGIIPKPGEP